MNLLKKILYYFRQIIKRLFFSIIELIPRNKFPIVFQIYSLFFLDFKRLFMLMIYINLMLMVNHGSSIIKNRVYMPMVKV